MKSTAFRLVQLQGVDTTVALSIGCEPVLYGLGDRISDYSMKGMR